MVLLSAAIVFAGLGWLGLSDSDSDGSETAVAATTTPAPPATTPANTSPANSTAATAAPPAGSTPASTATSTGASTTANSAALQRVPVRIYNNSTVDGLAATAADHLRAGGWTVTDVSNYAEGQISESTVFYGTESGAKDAADKLGKDMGLTVAPRFDGIADAPAGLIVILAGDGTN